jgi:c(7)-type cytochrome triheme protein
VRSYVCASAILLTTAVFAVAQGHPRARDDTAAPTPSPRAGLRLPADLTYESADTPAPVVFSHKSHTTYAQGQCLTCHPEPFRMLRPSHHTSHAEMDVSHSCGTCHDGRKAFATSDDKNCESCHKEARP